MRVSVIVSPPILGMFFPRFSEIGIKITFDIIYFRYNSEVEAQAYSAKIQEIHYPCMLDPRMLAAALFWTSKVASRGVAGSTGKTELTGNLDGPLGQRRGTDRSLTAQVNRY